MAVRFLRCSPSFCHSLHLRSRLDHLRLDFHFLRVSVRRCDHYITQIDVLGRPFLQVSLVWPKAHLARRLSELSRAPATLVVLNSMTLNYSGRSDPVTGLSAQKRLPRGLNMNSVSEMESRQGFTLADTRTRRSSSGLRVATSENLAFAGAFTYNLRK